MARFNTAPAAQSNDQSWKADGFFNIYLPKKDGGKYKVGAIALKSTVPGQKALLDMLKADPEKAMQAIVDAMTIEFREASNTAPEFAL